MFVRKVVNSSIFWKVVNLAILGLFVINQVFPKMAGVGEMSNTAVVKTVHASDIYPIFSCPCCGQPLNKEEPCCGAMIQMINYIDQKIGGGLSDDEILFFRIGRVN